MKCTAAALWGLVLVCSLVAMHSSQQFAIYGRGNLDDLKTMCHSEWCEQICAFPIDAWARLGSVSVCLGGKICFFPRQIRALNGMNARHSAHHFRAPHIAANGDECIMELNEPYAVMNT